VISQFMKSSTLSSYDSFESTCARPLLSLLSEYALDKTLFSPERSLWICLHSTTHSGHSKQRPRLSYPVKRIRCIFTRSTSFDSHSPAFFRACHVFRIIGLFVCLRCAIVVPYSFFRLFHCVDCRPAIWRILRKPVKVR
jgi:hypothetical protein